MRANHTHTPPLFRLSPGWWGRLGLICCFLEMALFLGLTHAAHADVSGGNAGPWVTYSKAGGDTWYNTWADDGNIYATSNDTSGFNGTCNNNLVVNEISGDDPAALTAPYVNCMTSFGAHAGDTQGYADGHTWKTGGMISVDGTLYVVVARQTGAGTNDYPQGLQVSEDASIIKSTDHGRTWSNSFGKVNDPNGAAPPYNATTGHVLAMFPGTRFSTPFFINYGQDDNPASTADGGDTYVYALSNDGFAYNGSTMILGRVQRDLIGNLNAADWQFYTGTPGGKGDDPANWSSNVSAAVPVLTAPNQLSQCAVQYIPALHEYILTSFYYSPFDSAWPGSGETAHTTWKFFKSSSPWGPWTAFYAQDTSPYGWYDPTLVSKFIHMYGLNTAIFTSGDFNNPKGQINGDILYRLHVFPFSLTSDSITAADDPDSRIHYQGNWTVTANAGPGSYEATLHYSNAPGASASYTFTGTSIAWIGATNNNHGDATVQVDNDPPVTVDTYSPNWGKQAVLFARNALPAGQHTITITVGSTRNNASAGVYQEVDAFVSSTSSLPVGGVLDDSASSIQYMGSWTASTTASGYYANTAHYSNTPGNSASYTFTGTSIAWIGARNTNHGYATVQVDNDPAMRVDTYSPQWEMQTYLFQWTGLPAGRHTITITITGNNDGASGGDYQDADAFSTGI